MRHGDEVGRLPGSRQPIRSPRPSAPAPVDRRHLERRRAGSAPGSRVASLWRNAAWRIASNMSRSLLLAAPSVPSPTRMPAAVARRHRRARRSPASCCSRDCAPRRPSGAARIACRPASSHTPCAAIVGRPQNPSDSRYARRRTCHVPSGRSPTSSRVSARWMSSGTSCRLASARAAFSVAASSV